MKTSWFGYRPHVRIALVASLLLGLSGQAMATHFRFGHITWRTIGSGGQVEITVTAAFRNGYAVTQVGEYFVEHIGNTSLSLGNGNFVNQWDWHVVGFEQGTDVVIAKLDPGRTGRDTIIETYAAAGTYDVQIDTCCRISPPTHINNPDGRYRMTATVTPSFGGAGNAAPISSPPSIVNFFEGSVNSYLLPSTDADADPLTFRLATALEASGIAGGFAQPGPPHAPNSLSIHPTTGLITWDTTGATVNPLGQTLYSCQIIISDGKSEVPLDMFFEIKPQSPNQCPEFVGPTPQNGSTIQVQCGDPISFTVQALDQDAGDVVRLNNLGIPSGASFSTTPGNPATASFDWDTNQVGDFIVAFQATDESDETLGSGTSGGCVASTSVNLRVTAPPVVLAPPFPGTLGPNDMTVSGYGAGETVVFYGSKLPGTTASSFCSNVILDMAFPLVLDQVAADPAGVAMLRRTAAPGLAGQTVYLQTLGLSCCVKSNLVVHTF